MLYANFYSVVIKKTDMGMVKKKRHTSHSLINGVKTLCHLIITMLYANSYSVVVKKVAYMSTMWKKDIPFTHLSLIPSVP